MQKNPPCISIIENIITDIIITHSYNDKNTEQSE